MNTAVLRHRFARMLDGERIATGCVDEPELFDSSETIDALPHSRSAMHVQDMMRTHPDAAAGPLDILAKCIEACFDCAQACTACADACLGEDGIQHLAACIRLNLDCADTCAATGRIATRRTYASASSLTEMLIACEALCRRCGNECRKHADMHEHCKICAEACSTCERACHDAVAALH